MTYTEQRQSQVFNKITTEAQVGDFFSLPWTPTFQILSKVDIGDYIAFVVQSGNNPTEHWDVMKPEAELREQERSRIEEGEAEMGEIIYDAALEELEEALGFSLRPNKYDWLTEPIGANPGYIFGMTGEQMAEVLPSVENAYHDRNWTGEDCEF